MNLLERIRIDPRVRFGKPCVRGTRITVGDVLGYLAGGMSEEEIRVCAGDEVALASQPPFRRPADQPTGPRLLVPDP